MSFINPLLLIGIIAAGIPLLIHLWSRRQARLVNFSYVRFLMALNRKKIRRLKIKQILILIIRTLIITMIVMALARPILSSKWALAVGKTKTSAVIILDNSYSMSYEDLKGKRFDIAKTKALSLLDYLKPGDNGALILMSEMPELVFKKLTSDIQQVKDSVKAASISHKGTNVLPAFSEAYNLLKESDHPYKVIYLISDLGENGWNLWKDLPESKYDIHIFVIRAGEMDSDNRSVDMVALSSEPVGIGSSVEISTRISSSFPGDISEALAELFIDGEKRGQAIANPKNPIIFNYKFGDSGFRIGEIRITPDKLNLDDVRYFVTNILGQVRVLSIGDSKLYVNTA
ncbi:VWA domain-containing protein, partial [Candidatus Poribacteria bacterium]|nr:VWA domain-containing protein [Candidatus Poribacteria bacterium]